MFRIAPAIAIVLSSIPSALAFSPSPARNNKAIARSSTTRLNYNPETYDRALDCANNFGLCGIDELLDLSEELDEYLGCYVEHGPEECEKEIDERQDLSEALLVQGEMLEHDIYIQQGNFFNPDEIIENRVDDGDDFWGLRP
mmetsp:Transcript_24269/g.41530  ORF Transcript_24269/g.41530 Transcript_24269/m.41530 type:complete len:142 (-) Transcript_24269:244-669(-)